jgi:DNA-binding response OmpR family regulator
MDAPLVWVISSDFDTRRLIALNLDKRGYRVREAPSQNELATSDEVPQLIVLDMNPPAESWRDAALALRQRDNSRKPPLILILPAAPTTRQLRDLQPVYWIEKPVAVDALLAVVRECVGRANLEERR